MNKRIKECENFGFLPIEYREREDLNLTEKNVLATLCYFYLRHSDYVAEHDGWFFKSGEELGVESGIDERTVYRTLVKLELKGLVKRKSGTNKKCTHYKLNPKITELLPKNEEFEEPEGANVTLEEKRLDESSPEETRRDEASLLEKKRMFNHKMSDEIKEFLVDDFDYSDVNQDTLEEYEMAIQDTFIPTEEDFYEGVHIPKDEGTEAQKGGIKDDNQDRDIEKQEFLKKRQLVVDRIREEASGKDYSGINKLTIPMYNWVSSEFPNECERFKRIVDSTLQKLKDELLAGMLSSASAVPAHNDDYPFL